MAKVLKEHISDAIFDAISLYCVENQLLQPNRVAVMDGVCPLLAQSLATQGKNELEG